MIILIKLRILNRTFKRDIKKKKKKPESNTINMLDTESVVTDFPCHMDFNDSRGNKMCSCRFIFCERQ